MSVLNPFSDEEEKVVSRNGNKPTNMLSESESRSLYGSGVLRSAVFAYHEITSEASPYSYAVTRQGFVEHLELVSRLRNRPGPKPSLHFSFDDGHISNYDIALPVLENHSCKATFFVIVGRIGQSQGFMTWEHLKELVTLGHRVGAHGWSHKFLTGCSEDELRTELARSKAELENRLGILVEGISAPHGRWNHQVAAACAAAGYQQLYTSTPWAGPGKVEGLEIIGRLIVTQSMDSASLANWLAMGHTRAGLYRARHALKQSLKLMLGDSLYHRMWTRYSGWEGPADF
jgi:peptidoglycan/xylan/chitin deacetylase (PgdA/CDA1 family)